MTAPGTVDTNAQRARTPGDTGHEQRRWRDRVRTHGGRALAVLGSVALVALSVGLTTDLTRFDPTSGGYEAPYTDYSGQPIDWDADTYDTPTGMVRTGHVVDVHVDCTSGMISLEVLGIASVDFRELSERAIAVHEPRPACEERGFAPRF